MLIKPSTLLVNEAVVQLSSYQQGKERPIVTSYDHFNEMSMGGIYKGNIITVAARAGIGKSYFVQQLESDMFNPMVNSDLDGVLLRCNWEMSVLKLLTRKIAKETRKSYREVLTRVPMEQDLPDFKRVTDIERNPNIFYMDIPTTPTVFEKGVGEFLEQHKDRGHVVVTIDHIGLVRDNGNKKSAIDELVEAINRLRNKYKNVSFIILMQMNREIESRTEVKDSAPRLSDLMSSDVVQQISDVVIALNVPYRMGLERYMVVGGVKTNAMGEEVNTRYSHLSKYMVNPKNKTTNFNTSFDDGRVPLLFYHYLKIRDGLDLSTYKDLFIAEMR